MLSSFGLTPVKAICSHFRVQLDRAEVLIVYPEDYDISNIDKSAKFDIAVGCGDRFVLHSKKIPSWFKKLYPENSYGIMESVLAVDVERLCFQIFLDQLISSSPKKPKKEEVCYHCKQFDLFLAPSKKNPTKLVCYRCCDRY